MYLVFDTETTGLPAWKEPSDHPDQPHVVDIAWTLYGADLAEIERFDAIVNPGVIIPDAMAEIHGITTDRALAEGIAPSEVWERFVDVLSRTALIVGQNVSFDIRLMRILATRLTGEKWDNPHPTFCTMREVHALVKSMPVKPDGWKWPPTLTQIIQALFNEEHVEAHRARPDCDATARAFLHLKSLEA